MYARKEITYLVFVYTAHVRNNKLQCGFNNKFVRKRAPQYRNIIYRKKQQPNIHMRVRAYIFHMIYEAFPYVATRIRKVRARHKYRYIEC